MARQRQALLRTDPPVAPQVAPIHPDVAFAPATHVQESVADFVQLKSATIESQRGPEFRSEGQDRKIGERQPVNFPAREFLPGEADALRDSFAVVHQARAEVNAAHVFHQDIQGLARLQAHLQLRMVQAPATAPKKSRRRILLVNDACMLGVPFPQNRGVASGPLSLHPTQNKRRRPLRQPLPEVGDRRV